MTAAVAIVNDDFMLMQQLATGDEKSLEKLFKKYYQPLCRFAFTYLKDEDACQDLVQEIFFKLWNNRESTSVTTSVKAYLFTSVKNQSLNVLSSKRHKLNSSLEDEFELADYSGSDNMDYLELESKYHSALEQLPPKCREVFLLSRNEGLSYKAIAETLGISVKTVENQMGKALQRLREMMLTAIILIMLNIL